MPLTEYGAPVTLRLRGPGLPHASSPFDPVKTGVTSDLRQHKLASYARRAVTSCSSVADRPVAVTPLPSSALE